MANWYGAAATAMFFVCGLCPASAGQPQLTASAVREMIRTEGADKAVRRLFEDRTTEGVLLNGIGTGGAGWLRVAQELRPVSDGAASEGLDIAIQDALARNPVGVLTLVRKGAFSETSACAVTMDRTRGPCQSSSLCLGRSARTRGHEGGRFFARS